MTIWVAYDWRMPRIFVALLVLELPLTVLNLVLMGVADPNTYRTKLWQDGANHGFNSNPNIILFSHANYNPVEPPMIWSQYMTTFNVVIAVFSMFVLLAKSAMFTMHFFAPLFSVVVHATLIALYAASLYYQTSGDYLDPKHPSPRPWYMTRSCSQYASSGNVGYCLQARASIATVVVMMVLFIAYLGYSLWSSVPTEQEKLEREDEQRVNAEMKSLSMYEPTGEVGPTGDIFLNLPKTPKTAGFGANNPMTPRTTAFARLNGGKAPESRAGPSSRSLPFREQYDKKGKVDVDEVSV